MDAALNELMAAGGRFTQTLLGAAAQVLAHRGGGGCALIYEGLRGAVMGRKKDKI